MTARAGAHRRHVRRPAVRSVPASVWLLTALYTLVLLSASVVTPVYRPPDEPLHVDAALLLRDRLTWPAPGALTLGEQVRRSALPPAVVGDPQARRPPGPFPAGQAPPRAQRPAFAALAGADERSAATNQLTQHPPLYYLAGAALLRLPGVDGWAFDRQVALLRLLSVAAVAPLPLLAFVAARRLLGPGPVPVAAAVVPLTIPQLAHIGAAVNNDGLLIGLCAALTALLARVATGDTSARVAVAVGTFGGLALLTKGLALVVPAWVAAAYALAGRGARRRAAAGGLALTLLAAVGGWWWARNVVVHGALQPAGIAVPDPPDGFEPQPAFYARVFLRWLVQRYWGSFGSFETALPWPAIVAAAAALALGVLLAFAVRPVVGRWSRAVLLVLLTPTAGTLAIVLWGGWRWYAATSQAAGIQGRYLFAGVAGLAVAVAVGYGAPDRRPGRWLPLLFLSGAALMQGLAGRTLLDHYWGGDPVALVAWSPWPAGAVVAVWVALAVVAVWLAACLFHARPLTPAPAPATSPGRRPAPAHGVGSRAARSDRGG